jgi:hypothetical protein
MIASTRQTLVPAPQGRTESCVRDKEALSRRTVLRGVLTLLNKPGVPMETLGDSNGQFREMTEL